MARILFWGVLLLLSFEIQGLQHVFLLRGKDLHLDINKSVVLDKKTDLFWKFNETNNVAKYGFNNDPIVYDKYEGRAELFGQNYSLLLKNVKSNDTGDYTAVLTGAQDLRVAEYKVIVQDPVSPANLRVVSVPSSDSCNLTVTCSTVDSQISKTFRCDTQNCSQVDENSLKKTNDYSSLIVYLHRDLIICNHSNNVSWKQSTMNNPYCEKKTVSSAPIIIAAACGLCVFVFIIIFIICIVRKCKRRNQENQLYEAAQEYPPGQTRNENVPGDASSLSPTSTYALVEFHPKTESTKSKKNPQPETVYAQVTRATRPRVTAQQTELENISSTNSQG
ncbi:uncharacterized protein LOC116332085 [Oreochromis aureus]|uniref:Immunoglobulin subtype domain-containing protein n=1 Tax=Oreochromis aureus TaxID=47969 RepID=A0AAZ1XWR2_OREAU|nr:uncharacterized protein LOC116332085 [Oreochromis aureus]